MSRQPFNTATGRGQVSICVGGATVQAPPHIGHRRSGVAFDLSRRWLIVVDSPGDVRQGLR